MSDSYPKDRAGKFFSHRVVRLMLRTCAAQEIGHVGCMIVVAVASTEDAKRYTGHVTYWNDQLMSILNISWDQLDRARRKAIKFGWLHYEAGGKSKVGKYWTLIPDQFQNLPDGPVDCDINTFIAQNPDTNPEQKSDTNADTNPETSLGETGDKLGANPEHSSLSLSLALTPERRVACAVDFGKVDSDLLGDTAGLLKWAGGAIDCDADRLRFVAAAERSLEKAKNPAAMFVKIIKQRDWAKTNQAQEDRAIERLKALRADRRNGFLPAVTGLASTFTNGLTDD